MKQQPAAFMSYAHHDNDHDGGALTKFRERLSGEVWTQMGEEFQIFQDRAHINWGENRRQRIETSLNGVTFLIPIITPSFFHSQHCCDELLQFLNREKKLKRNDFILPVYYVNCPQLDDAENLSTNELTQVITTHQYADWRKLRFESFDSPQVAKAFEQLAIHICNALSRTQSSECYEPSKGIKTVSVSVSEQEIEIIIDKDFDAHTEADQEQFLRAIGELLKMEKGDIRIKRKRRGSVRLTLGLPPHKAEELLWAIKAGQFEEYDVVDAELKEPEETAEAVHRQLVEERVWRLGHEDIGTLGPYLATYEAGSTADTTQVNSMSRNTIGMEFVLIPAGSFMMGSPDTDAEAFPNEKPAHRVMITQQFYLGKYEVTQGEWRAVMGRNPSGLQGDPDLPVENVSWDDAQAFIQKLNAKEGGTKYRLPTEAEWEYAARAGTEGTHYHTDIDAIAWYRNNSNEDIHAVGQKLPNAWGLYDMLGNVWEWVQDWSGRDYYEQSSTRNPQGPAEGASRVVRGGGWSHDARFCRAALRFNFAPGLRDFSLGFRLARSASLSP